MRKIFLTGTQLTLIDLEQLLEYVSSTIDHDRKHLILSGNVYSYNLAYDSKWLRDLFNRANAVRLDGAGVRLGARILGYETPPRMTWADFGWDLAALAADRGYRVFLLGARQGVAQQAAATLQELHPTLQIVGVQHGYFDKTYGSAENQAVVMQIRSAKPEILIVGFGMPLQERWLLENWPDLNVNVTFTGGAVFDYISGNLRRPPRWMNDHGLEWFGRLVIEPRRLWQRYVIGNPLFFWRILKQRFGLLRVD